MAIRALPANRSVDRMPSSSEVKKQRRLDLLAIGACPGHPDSSVLPGKSFCARCAKLRAKARTTPAGVAYRASEGALESQRQRNRTLKARLHRANYRRTEKGRAVRRRTERKARATRVEYRLRKNLRARFWRALNAQACSKRESTLALWGCSVDELKTRLERQFRPGMTWANWGRDPGTWQIDHIKPLASFDLADLEQQRAACHYSNLQPLWHDDHLRKSIAENRALSWT